MELDAKTLQTLIATVDRLAIENVLGTYCRAIDRLDVELLKSVYHPDGVDDHGAMKLNAHEFAEQIIEKLRNVCEYSMHTVTQTVIDVKDDKASRKPIILAFIPLLPAKNPSVISLARTISTRSASQAHWRSVMNISAAADISIPCISAMASGEYFIEK